MKDYKVAKLGNLLGDTDEAFYWAGLLMADGTSTENRISLTLAKRDDEHLRRFGKFVEYKGKANSYLNSRKIACMDTGKVPLIRERFDFKNNKTENPPSELPEGSDGQRLAFVIGFIDGDGSITTGKGRRFCNIRVKVHGSWLGVLRQMACLVYGLAGCSSGAPKLNALGYAEWVVSDSVVTKFLKKKMMEMKLPAMNRKWDKVGMEVGIQEQSLVKLAKIRELAKARLNCTQIAKAVGEKITTVWHLARRHGIEMCKYKNGMVASV